MYLHLLVYGGWPLDLAIVPALPDIWGSFLQENRGNDWSVACLGEAKILCADKSGDTGA